MGISLREFDGWTPSERTTVTAWDEQGRPSEWVTRRESAWDTRERSWMLALDWYESSLCRKCGQPLAECTDPDNDPDDLESPRMYVAEPDTECYSCKVLVRVENARGKSDPESSAYVIHQATLIDRPRGQPAKPKASS